MLIADVAHFFHKTFVKTAKHDEDSINIIDTDDFVMESVSYIELLEMITNGVVDIDNKSYINGRITLRRKRGKVIDRVDDFLIIYDDNKIIIASDNQYVKVEIVDHIVFYNDKVVKKDAVYSLGVPYRLNKADTVFYVRIFDFFKETGKIVLDNFIDEQGVKQRLLKELILE